MKKKRTKPQRRRLTPAGKIITEDAIRQVAMRHGVPVEEVRRQIQIAMLNGLVNDQMGDVPIEGEIPTPEGLIAYGAERVIEKMDE